MRVLEQKYGRCWDFFDVFVTLCRAANIPSRQVIGWIYGKSGNVWVEYFIPEKGWCSIDPSTPSSGITTDYVPFFISEDGELPAIYWDEPHLNQIKTNR
jgi:transglutaminase-like putative cysteine protease